MAVRLRRRSKSSALWMLKKSSLSLHENISAVFETTERNRAFFDASSTKTPETCVWQDIGEEIETIEPSFRERTLDHSCCGS